MTQPCEPAGLPTTRRADLPNTPLTGGGNKTPPRRGAAGKALIVYLFSGSAVLALLAFVLFRGMGC